MAPIGAERQGFGPGDRRNRQLAIEMRKQLAAARGLPFERVTQGVGVDRRQHEIVAPGEPFGRGLRGLLGG